MKTPLIYALHSGNLYGTERMAIATAELLAAEFEPVIMAPPGPALQLAGQMGLETLPFSSTSGFFTSLWPLLRTNRDVVFMATAVTHSLAAIAWSTMNRSRMAHLHVVHGGADERLSYGRKRLLNRARISLVAVSSFVKARLIANGVSESRIRVVENFLPASRIDNAPRRAPFESDGIRRVIVVSRLDPIKRVDLLLEALEQCPDLAALQIRIFGTGWDEQTLRERARQCHPNVTFEGFHHSVESAVAGSDLLLHLCPCEPFGLAILEAMAAGLPVLVPNTGGASSLVVEGKSGFHFEASDSGSLASRLRELMDAPAGLLNCVVAGGDHALSTRFSQDARIDDYRRLIREQLA